MYIMKKMNREKKAKSEAEREALLADGYTLVSADKEEKKNSKDVKKTGKPESNEQEKKE